MTEPPRLRLNTWQTTLVYLAVPTIIVTATVTYPRVFMGFIVAWILGTKLVWHWRQDREEHGGGRSQESKPVGRTKRDGAETT